MSTCTILKQSLPKRIEILNILNQLIAGSISRDKVSDWAISLINNDSISKTDNTAWKVLEGLGAADLPATDQEFLYTIDDFLAWKSELLAPWSI